MTWESNLLILSLNFKIVTQTNIINISNNNVSNLALTNFIISSNLFGFLLSNTNLLFVTYAKATDKTQDIMLAICNWTAFWGFKKARVQK